MGHDLKHYRGTEGRFYEHIATDYTVQIPDDDGTVFLCGSPLTITLPEASGVPESSRDLWSVTVGNESTGRVMVQLSGTDTFPDGLSTVNLEAKGNNVEFGVHHTSTHAGWFKKEVQGREITDYLPIDITTRKGELSGATGTDTLTLNGTITDIGNNDHAYVNFQYREVGTSVWANTAELDRTSNGDYSQTDTVDGTKTWEYRAQARNADNEYTYGAILYVGPNYYNSAAEAMADRCRGVWFPDAAGDADDHVGSKDGVGAGTYSKVDDGGGEYHVDFGADGYIEIDVQIQQDRNVSMCVYYLNTSTSGDHTILSNGTNILSYASDGTSQQIEAGGKVKADTGVQPVSSYTVYFIVHDKTALTTTLYVWDGANISDTITVTNRALPDDGEWIRIARGAVGDNNHQDTEYCPNMNWKELGWWRNKKLNETEMKGIAEVLVSGGHICP